MPRAPRTDVGGLVYHVLNRANAGAALFADEVDYRLFTELLAEGRARAGMRLLAWCLMPSHWHLVLWPHGDGELGRFVRRLTQRHTQAWHGRRGTRGQGHLYQGRYKAFLVQDDAHLVTVCRYVERNPVRAGLVASAADWPHGSLAELRRRGAARLLDPGQLPRPSRWAAAVDRPETPQELEALRRSVQRGTPFGSAGWVAAMADRFDLRSTLRPPGRPPRAPAVGEGGSNESLSCRSVAEGRGSTPLQRGGARGRRSERTQGTSPWLSVIPPRNLLSPNGWTDQDRRQGGDRGWSRSSGSMSARRGWMPMIWPASGA